MSFFDNGCLTKTNWQLFGIIDDNNFPNNPAYINDSNPNLWDAIVTNNNRKNLKFYAIDKCIRFYKPNEPTKPESTCDAAIADGQTIYFIEIKKRASAGWLGKASKQIINTIKLYKTHDINGNTSLIIGQVCNSLRPRANAGHAVAIKKFKLATNGCKLVVEQNIDIA